MKGTLSIYETVYLVLDTKLDLMSCNCKY